MSAGGNAIFNDQIKTGNMSISGQEIDVSSGDLTVDVAGELKLDADGGNITLQDGGTAIGQFQLNDSNHLKLVSKVSDADIFLQGNDGGSVITAVRFDMSNGGRADFSNDISLDDGRVLRLGTGDDTSIYNDGSNFEIVNTTTNQDIIFKGNDDGSNITALTLDMSDAGNATFNDGATFGSGIVAPRIKSTQVTVAANSSSTALDFSTSNNFMVNMTADTTFSFSNISGAVGCSGNIIIVQDGTGGRDFTLPSEAKTPVNGATIVQNTGADEISVLSYYVMSSSQVLVNYIGDFA